MREILTKIKKEPKNNSLLVFFKKNNAGHVKIEIHNRLKEYVPITERICKKYVFSENCRQLNSMGNL